MAHRKPSYRRTHARPAPFPTDPKKRKRLALEGYRGTMTREQYWEQCREGEEMPDRTTTTGDAQIQRAA